MQKKLIALAVAGLVAAPVFAQYNVTIYGVADATFDVINASGGSDWNTKTNRYVDTNKNDGSFNRITTNSSLIGFKGSEDLGNGLKAVFQFESAVGFDNLGGLAANRDSYVGVAGGFGTVIAGNITGPTRLVGATVDVNSGATGIGANSGLLGKLDNALGARVDTTVSTGVAGNSGARSSTNAGAFDTRLTNAIAYVSPSFSGLTFIGGYVANENKINSLGAASGANSSAFDLGLTYGNGPIWGALTHAELDTKNGTGLKPKNTRAAFKYDFGMADVRVLLEQTKNQGDKQNVWGLGTKIKAGAAGNVIAQYYKANSVSGYNGSTGANLFELGYEHSLTKRTILKAIYARMDNKSDSNYDFGVSTSGVATYGSRVSGLQVGLRHSF